MGCVVLYINGHPHGLDGETTTCQLHIRRFHNDQTITIEPWRSAAFPVIKDLMVDRGAFDKIIQGINFGLNCVIAGNTPFKKAAMALAGVLSVLYWQLQNRSGS